MFIFGGFEMNFECQLNLNRFLFVTENSMFAPTGKIITLQIRTTTKSQQKH